MRLLNIAIFLSAFQLKGCEVLSSFFREVLGTMQGPGNGDVKANNELNLV